MDKYFVIEILFLCVSLGIFAATVLIAKRVADSLVLTQQKKDLERVEHKLDQHLLWHLNHRKPGDG